LGTDDLRCRLGPGAEDLRHGGGVPLRFRPVPKGNHRLAGRVNAKMHIDGLYAGVRVQKSPDGAKEIPLHLIQTVAGGKSRLREALELPLAQA
jgi:hypothetical protein